MISQRKGGGDRPWSLKLGKEEVEILSGCSEGQRDSVPAVDIDGISGLQVLTRLAAALLEELGSRGKEGHGQSWLLDLRFPRESYHW